MAALDYQILDVFTRTPYEGNPLAVVILPAEFNLRQDQKQRIAKEFNLSETAFVHEAAPGRDVTVDIFMTDRELPFAGHPTIGSAFYLLSGAPDIKAVLTKAGRIPIQMNSHGDVLASIPHDVHCHELQIPCNLPGAGQGFVFSIVKGMTFGLIELPDEATLAQANRNIAGDFSAEHLDEGWQVGYMGTSYYVKQPSDAQDRIVIRTRMWDSFEDPATGSAACALTCFLSLQLSADQGPGPFSYSVIQGVEMGRPSQILTTVTRTVDGRGISAVQLGGSAVKVMEGKLNIPAQQ